MRLVTPRNLHYPITVTKLRCKTQDEVAHNGALFDYQYKSKVIEGSDDNKEGKVVERTYPSTFESYVEGSLTKWLIKENDKIFGQGWVMGRAARSCRMEIAKHAYV